MEPMTATAEPVHSPVELEVHRIRELLKNRRFAQSVAAAEALAADVPQNRDVLYLMAMGQRQLGKLSEALVSLRLLEQHHPAFSRLYQERGHCFVALKQAPQAIEAFLKAVNI